jgi:hypothetical protein
MKGGRGISSQNSGQLKSTKSSKTEVTMKRANADITNWVIELRDGALQVQRSFPFAHGSEMERFVGYVGKFMKSPGMSVMASSHAHPRPSVTISIEVLPERALLKAVGEIAATCEHAYSEIQSLVAQSAA